MIIIKKKTILTIVIIAMFIASWLILTNVKAAGVTLGVGATSSKVKPGDSVTININLGGQMGAATVNVAYNNSLFDYVSASGGTANNLGSSIRIIFFDSTGGSSPRNSMSVTFRAKTKGTGAFNVTGNGFSNADATEIYNPVNPGSTSVTIEEEVITPPPVTTPETPSGTGNTGNNNQNNTGGTGTNPNTGNSNTSTSTTSSNAFLKSLRLDIEGLTPSFERSKTSYSITVSNSVNTINVTATPEDASAKVNVAGNTNLQIGSNKISVAVTAPDNKTKKTYTINVTKTDNPALANTNLTTLAVENETLMPEFSPENTEYTMQVKSDIEKLNILAVPEKQGATAVISGNEQLEFGENLITISVTAEDKITTKDYTINVHKMTREEEEALELELAKDIMPLVETDEILNEVKKGNGWAIGIGATALVVAAGIVGYIIYTKNLKGKRTK